MTYRELFMRMAQACVAFTYTYQAGGQWITRVWAGAFIGPNTILTVSHAWGREIRVMREVEIDPSQVTIVDALGRMYPIRRQDVTFPPTGDLAVVQVPMEGPAYLPLGEPSRVPPGAVVYMWAYPVSYEGYPREGLHDPEVRYPFWGLWSLGWWEGPVSPTGALSPEGRDYALLMPSARGQSGSPCVRIEDGVPRLLGVLSVTYSTQPGLGLAAQARSEICSIEHLANLRPEEVGAPRWELVWARISPYVVPAALGVVGGIVLSRMAVGGE